jgi:hypothetical protein
MDGKNIQTLLLTMHTFFFRAVATDRATVVVEYY